MTGQPVSGTKESECLDDVVVEIILHGYRGPGNTFTEHSQKWGRVSFRIPTTSSLHFCSVRDVRRSRLKVTDEFVNVHDSKRTSEVDGLGV